MVRVILVLVMGLITGCASPHQAQIQPVVQVRDVAPELERFVFKFEYELGVSITFPVQFYTANTAASVGLCVYNGDGSRYVYIDLPTFNAYNDAQREQLIYHELGHCVLGRTHRIARTSLPGEDGNIWPVSIMQDVSFSTKEAEVYLRHRDYYIQELKGY